MATLRRRGAAGAARAAARSARFQLTPAAIAIGFKRALTAHRLRQTHCSAMPLHSGVASPLAPLLARARRMHPLQWVILFVFLSGSYINTALIIAPVFGFGLIGCAHLLAFAVIVCVAFVAYIRAAFTDPGSPADFLPASHAGLDTSSETTSTSSSDFSSSSAMTMSSLPMSALTPAASARSDRDANDAHADDRAALISIPLDSQSASSASSSSTTTQDLSALTVSAARVEVDSAATVYCAVCAHFKPPRTHHCSQCRRCVLRMDHHCVWLGQCVGLRNYKFFISFLAWTTVACNFSLYLLLVRLLCAYWLSALTAAPLKPLSTVASLWVLVVAGLQCLGTGMSVFLQRMHFALMARNMTTLELMKVQQVEQQRAAASMRSHHSNDDANGNSNADILGSSSNRGGGANSASLASRASAALQRHLPHWAAHWLPGHSHSHSHSGTDAAYAPVATAADDDGGHSSASSIPSHAAGLYAEAAADAPHRWDLGDDMANMRAILGSRQQFWLLPFALPSHELGDGRGFPVNPALTTTLDSV